MSLSWKETIKHSEIEKCTDVAKSPLGISRQEEKGGERAGRSVALQGELMKTLRAQFTCLSSPNKEQVDVSKHGTMMRPWSSPEHSRPQSGPDFPDTNVRLV